MLYPLYLASVFVLSLFVLCWLGNLVTDYFEQIGNVVYQGAWPLYPIELRKKLPVIILIAQKPIYISGFGIIVCSLESYKVVCNKFPTSFENY